MNIKITYNWLLEYLETDASPYDIQKYLSLCGPSVEKIDKIGDDYVFDIEITSNRVDAASVYGIAREAAVILNQFGKKTTLKPLLLHNPSTPSKELELTVIDSNNLCKRILAIVMDNVTIKRSFPYIQKRLEAAGIRSLNNAVDITNYVMTEIGYPTHVFDYDRIATHKLILRHAKENEEIITLDKKKYHLNKEDIVIDDGTGRVIDLPGIMGTDNSVVVNDTKRVIFFIESNDPVAIRSSSMRYGIRTMAATINEKNPDPELAKTALLRGIQLFKELTGANIASKVFDIYPKPYIKPKQILINYSFFNKIIGVDIAPKDIDQILISLGFKINHLVNDRIKMVKVTVPSWRQHDVNIKEDLIEEVARIYGYHNLPNRLPPLVYIKQPKDIEELFVYQSKVKYFLKHLGLNEVMNYSMISEEMINNNDLQPTVSLRIKNTISEEIKYMRTHLTPSLIKNIRDNEGKREVLRLFEIAKTYKPVKEDLPKEEYKLGIVTNTSYSDLKGIVDAIFKEFNIENFDITPSNHPLFVKGTRAKIEIDKDKIGEFGQLSKKYQLKNKLISNVYLAVFDFKTLIKYYKPIGQYHLITPYSEIKLDLTVESKPELSYDQIRKVALKTSKLLQKIKFVSLFKNKLSLRFYFSSPSKNITEEEAMGELDRINNQINKSDK